MHRPKTKREKITHLIITAVVMPVSVIVIVSLLVGYILGYRFNLSDNSITQGGLLQLGSTPSSAKVVIDDEMIRNTPGRADLASGSHTLHIDKDGYRSWYKNITINPGKILWNNYVRLIPEDPTIKAMRSYSSVDSSVVSSGGNRIAIIENKTMPTITIEDITVDTPEQTVATIPSTLYAQATKKDARHTFELVDWAPRGDSVVLVRHTVGNIVELLSVNIIDTKRSSNITTILGQEPRKVQYMRSQDDQVIVLAKDGIRIVDVQAKTVSAPVVKDAIDFEYGYDNYISYLKKTNLTDVYEVGYWTPGAQSGRIIQKVKSTTRPRMQIAQYDRKQFFAIQTDTMTTLYQSQLPASSDQPFDRDKDTTLQHVIKTKSSPDSVTFSPSGRFVSVKQGLTVYNYDIELADQHEIQLSDTLHKKDSKLQWLSDFHYWTSNDKQVAISEYDGNNTHALAVFMPDQAVTFSRNGNYLYVMQQQGKKVQLARISMLVE